LVGGAAPMLAGRQIDSHCQQTTTENHPNHKNTRKTTPPPPVPGLDLGRHHQEGLLHVGRGLCAGLDERNAQLRGKVRRCVVLHHALLYQIALVAHQQLVHVVGGVSVDLVQPLLDVVERIHVGHVVHNNDAVRATVVRAGDSAEPLLTGSIPDLQLNGLSVQLNRSDFLHWGQSTRLRALLQTQRHNTKITEINRGEMHTKSTPIVEM
jgi:hypothetical protein